MKRLCSILALTGAVILSSCDGYDDSQLKEAISSLEDRVTTLESLNDEIEALKSIVEGKVTVVSVDESGDSYLVTLSDGKVLDIKSGVSDVSVVTVINDDDRNYWAYYTDGEIKPLLYAGNKVEVTSVIPGIRINENNRISISVDGGKTWVESDTSLSSGLFSKVESLEDCLVLTLSDGYTEFRVPFAQESVMQFVAFSGKQYFAYGESKDIPVEMVGVDNFTVTEKPDGWKASLSKGVIKITAPAEGSGETSGVVKMLGIGEEPMIAQVYVAIGTAPCSVVISDDRQVTVTPAGVTCFYGAKLLSEFDPAALVKELGGVTNPMLSRYPYAVSAVTMPLTDLLPEVLSGETYVVWALPMGSSYTEADIIYEAVSSIGVSYEVSDMTFEDARISVGLKGTDTFYLIPMQDDMTLDNVISDLNGSYAATYDRYKHTSSFRGLLSDIADSPMAGEKYQMLVLPVKLGQFCKADAVTFEVVLNEYTRGGMTAVSLEVASREMKSLSINVTAQNFPYKVMTSVVSAEVYSSEGYADDKVLLDYLATLSAKVYSEPYVHEAKYLESGTEYWVVAVAVDANGVMGNPARLQTSTKGIEYSSSLVEIGEVVLTLDSASIPVSASDDIVSYRYMCVSSSEGGYWYSVYIDNDAAAYESLIYGTSTYKDVSVTDVINIGGLEFGTNYIFRIIGYDAEGKITAMAKVDFSPSVGKVIACSDQLWIDSKPTVSSVIKSNAIKLTVTFPKDFICYYLTGMSSEEYVAQAPGSARLKTDFVLGHRSVKCFTDNITSYNPGWYISADKPYILITWEDENGWHEPLIYDSATGNILN